MKQNIEDFCGIACPCDAFTLTSCGGKDKEKDNSETTGTSSVTETEEKNNEGEIVIPSGGIELPIVKP